MCASAIRSAMRFEKPHSLSYQAKTLAKVPSPMTAVVVEGNHYFPADAVNPKFLLPSNTKTMCSWKGQASYHTLFVDGDGPSALARFDGRRESLAWLDYVPSAAPYHLLAQPRELLAHRVRQPGAGSDLGCDVRCAYQPVTRCAASYSKYRSA